MQKSTILTTNIIPYKSNHNSLRLVTNKKHILTATYTAISSSNKILIREDYSLSLSTNTRVSDNPAVNNILAKVNMFDFC